MGLNISKDVSIPSLKDFSLIVEKIEKLKSAGFTTDDIYYILKDRVEKVNNERIGINNESNSLLSIQKEHDISFKILKSNNNCIIGNIADETKKLIDEKLTKSTGLVLLIDDFEESSKVSVEALKKLRFEVLYAKSAKSGA